MSSCAVYGCGNNSLTSDPSVHYYMFPKSVYSQQWIQACGWQSNHIDVDTARICSIHFDDSAYNTEIKMVEFTACYAKTLRHDAVPTLYLPQTQIVIKDNPLDLDNLKNVVVYTINSTNVNDGITTICLPDEALRKQFFYLQPSTSDIKIETHAEPLEEKVVDNIEKYSHIKSYPDLYVLQANNKSLKRKTEILKKEISDLEQVINTGINEYERLEKQRRILKAKLSNKNLSEKDQRKLLAKVFSQSQIKILFGKKKLYWTNDDIAVGYTIRHLSNKRCYTYLTKTLNIPLPAISSIKRWVTTKKVKKPQSTNNEDESIE